MISLTELQRDAMTELFNIGMGQAAASLSRMVQEEIILSVPFLDFLSRYEVRHRLKQQCDSLITTVTQQFQGPFWGDAVLLFPEDKSLELVRLLMKELVPLEFMTEMEQEALSEVGNIILNSCLCSISDMLHKEVMSSLPLCEKMSLDDVLYTNKELSSYDKKNLDEECVMFLRMDFSIQKKDIKGYIAFVLDVNSVEQFKENINALL